VIKKLFELNFLAVDYVTARLFSIRVFDNEGWKFTGRSIINLKVALYLGSSKQGNARLALVVWN
jgi:hypothetical protein